MTTSDVQSPAVPADVRAAHGFDPAQSAGLFVGISCFDDELFTAVPFAVDDAVDLAYLFAFDLRLMMPPKVVLGLAGDPRKVESQKRLEALRVAGARVTSARQVEVYAQLDAQRRAAGTNGLFVASLATHGFSDQGGDFLVAADSLRRRIERTGVAVAELFDDVARSPAPRRLVLLDACRERLSADTRAGRETQAAMSRSFAAAIASASGQAVLAGATIGGYAYDDPARRNGVFTGALLDGLMGRAGVDERGFITVRTLADYADRRVVEWVRDRRPDHAAVSQGIARRLEGAAALLPLAVDPARRQAEEAWRSRRDAALVRLRENFGEIITGAFYDQVATAVDGERPRPEVEPLLEEIEALDGEARSQRSLAYYFQRHFPPRHQETIGGSGSVAAPRVLPAEPAAHDPELVSVLRTAPGRWSEGWRWIRNVLRVLAMVSVRQILRLAVLVVVALAAWTWLRPLWIGESPVPEHRAAIRPASPPSATDHQEELKAGSPLEGPIGMRFRYVPAGTFRMGSPETETERGEEEFLHRVELTRAFWIGETEVTQGQWHGLMGTNPATSNQCGKCPVEAVNWFEALAFANRLSNEAILDACYQLSRCNGKEPGQGYECSEVKFDGLDCEGYRLPTEAEWEYAARAGQETPFSTGLNLTTDQANYDGNHPYADNPSGEYREETVEVRTFAPNAWSLYEVHGNVYEWVWDWYGDYPQGSVEDPKGVDNGSARGVRGGGWNSNARYCRSASRAGDPPGTRKAFVGFRLVRTAG